jgi:hypothetical protein
MKEGSKLVREASRLLMKWFLQQTRPNCNFDRQDKLHQKIYFKFIEEDSGFFSIIEVKGRSRIYIGKRAARGL